MLQRERIKELLKRFRSSRTLKREIKVVRSYWVTAETFEVSNFENFVGEPARERANINKRTKNSRNWQEFLMITHLSDISYRLSW